MRDRGANYCTKLIIIFVFMFIFIYEGCVCFMMGEKKVRASSREVEKENGLVEKVMLMSLIIER